MSCVHKETMTWPQEVFAGEWMNDITLGTISEACVFFHMCVLDFNTHTHTHTRAVCTLCVHEGRRRTVKGRRNLQVRGEHNRTQRTLRAEGTDWWEGARRSQEGWGRRTKQKGKQQHSMYENTLINLTTLYANSRNELKASREQLLILQRSWIQILDTTSDSPQLSVTPAPGYPPPSSGL